MQHIILKRYVTLAYRPKWLFQLLAPRLVKHHFAVTAALHRFTERIIKARRKEILKKQQAEVNRNQQKQNGGMYESYFIPKYSYNGNDISTSAATLSI